MGVFFNTQEFPVFKNAVVTIGTFDGVHKGHKTILQNVVARAKEVGGDSVLITFEPHPRKLLFPSQSLGILTPLAEKSALILEIGIQHIVVAPFTHAFSQLSAEDYIQDFLVKTFRPHTIIIGHDHHFGHDRKGDINLLRQFESKYNYRIEEIPVQLIDDAAVSSTKIRKALEAGHVTEAANMLGRNYTLSGTVIQGAKLGRTLGYPTANIKPASDDQLIPAIGIYAVMVYHNTVPYKGMLSIGYNPTVTDEKKINIEVNIFDFDLDIYDQSISLEFVAWMRNEQKFDSLDALKAQLHKDKIMSLEILA